MNIGFFTAEYSPQLSGAVARVKGLCKGLSEAGNKVFVFVPSNKYSREEDDFCTVYRLPYLRFKGLGKTEDYLKFNISRYVYFLKKCSKIIKDEKIDILHARQPLDFYAAAVKLGKKFKIPVILESHRLLSTTEFTLGNCSRFRSYFLKKLELKLLNKAKTVIVLSETGINQQISEGIKVPVKIIPNAYNLGLINAKSEKSFLEKRKFILLYTGTLRKAEGVETLVNAIPYLAKRLPSFILIIVGSGEELENLKTLVKKLGIEQYVCFTGKISDAQLKFYYENATLLVHPRKNIPYQQSFIGIKVYDTLHFGVPIVTGNFGELSDFIKRLGCGLLSKPDDPKDFAEKVSSILTNKNELNLLKKRTLAAGKHFDWKTSGKLLSKLYAETINAKQA